MSKNPFITDDASLRAAMAEQKAQKSRVDGSKKTRAERQAEAGTSIADLVEPVFNELDKNGDGSVSFAELLRVLFPFASKEEFETMLSWVAKDAPKPRGADPAPPPPPPTPPPPPPPARAPAPQSLAA